MREFAAFAAKSGNLPGVLTEVIHAVPHDAGSGGVAALFLDDLPLAVWLTLTDSRLHQSLLRRLLSEFERRVDAAFSHGIGGYGVGRSSHGAAPTDDGRPQCRHEPGVNRGAGRNRCSAGVA